jgi:N-acetylglucosaminyldiphosphoundecaprenol N-acetyl-beta-D-mannosaminyltransferase
MKVSLRWRLQIQRTVSPPNEQILGITFFTGTAAEAVARITASGGFLVAPSAPGMVRLAEDEPYRRAMTAADVAIPDSGFMVLLWRLLGQRSLERLSGLRYLKQLLATWRGERIPEIVYVLPNSAAQEKLLEWSRRESFPVKIENCYIAPHYGREIEDRCLVDLLEQRRPAHVLIGIGSGPQEKLGHYLRENLSFRLASHCIGAALGFITGHQIAIPDWADRFYLGWLLRFLAQPRLFAPRVLMSLHLAPLVFRYRQELPPLAQKLKR